MSIAQVGVVDGDVDVFDLGQHRNGGGRGVNAAGGFGFWNALNAVHAQFKLEFGKRPTPADLRDDFLEPARGAFARRDNLGFPAMLAGVALIHAEEIAGEDGCLVAACPAADFQDDVALIHRVLGQQRGADFLLERQPFGFQHRYLRAGDGAHLWLGRRVSNHRVEIGQLGGDATISLHALGDRAELGELAREFYIGLGRE